MVADDPMQLSPRRSFAAWSEIVRGTALPWSNAERVMARAIGTALVDIIVQVHAVRLLIAEHQLAQIRATVGAAREPVLLGDVTVAPGQLVVIALGGANRDPAVFEEPDVVNIMRPDNRHLAFSHGPHYCLGAMLARSETQLALASLFRRFPSLRLVEDAPRWKANQVFRGLETLPVAWEETS